MIRINLLPIRAAKKRAAGQRQLGLLGALVLIVVVTLVGLHLLWAGDLDKIKRRNSDITAAIAKLKAEVGDYDKVRERKEQLLRQRNTIQKLQTDRAGPVYLMREISHILTKDKGPTFDPEWYEKLLRSDPNAGYNPSWDPRKIWITSFRASGAEVEMDAIAKSNEDVAEFHKRLDLSLFFSNVRLDTTTAVGTGKQRMFKFQILAKANF